jgi:hypothetical protein
MEEGVKPAMYRDLVTNKVFYYEAGNVEEEAEAEKALAEALSKPTSRLFRVLDRTGDTRHVWDSGDEIAVEKARSLFNKLLAEGHIAFSVGRNGEQGERVDSFDPGAETLIFTKPPVGG